MDRFRIFLRAWIAFAVAACAGCSTTRQNAPDSFARSEQSTANSSATGAAATSAALAEVQQLGFVDPRAQQALLEDMKKTDPSLWPQLVQVFRASMAYHQQSAARLAQASGESSPMANNAPQFFRQVAYSDISPGSGPELNAPGVPNSLPTGGGGAIFQQVAGSADPPTYPDTNLPPVRLAAAARMPSEMTLPPKEATAPASSVAVQAVDWNTQLTAAIRALEAQAERAQLNSADELRLRLLYLAAGRPEDAAKAMSASPDGGSEFWQEEMSALATLLDDQAIADRAQRSEEAGHQFHAAAASLTQNAPVRLHNPNLCTEVNSYGIYKTFPSLQFKPGQEVLLYAEVENFKSTASEQGFHTVLHGHYRILDKSGARVAEQGFATTEEYCRNQRKDFFVRYYTNIPKTLPPGDYTLQLTVEDSQANKAGQAELRFSVE
jgi:hypothetical protein